MHLTAFNALPKIIQEYYLEEEISPMLLKIIDAYALRYTILVRFSTDYPEEDDRRDTWRCYNGKWRLMNPKHG